MTFRGGGLVRSRRAALFLLDAIWSTDVIVFALVFWELDAGGRSRGYESPHGPDRTSSSRRTRTPQLAPKDWSPQVWDYAYFSLTNAIAFGPTDVMPLSLRAKATMGLESAMSAVTVLLVTARAVNVLGA